MTKELEMYKCSICGNLVSVVESGQGELVCCGKKMDLLSENTKENEKGEKHVPIISVEGNLVTVKVGEIEHPMDDNHFIELIQLFDGDGNVYGKRLKPKDKPIAKFHVENTSSLKARELCNIHGLWKSD